MLNEIRYATIRDEPLDVHIAAERFHRAVRLVGGFARQFGWADLGERVYPDAQYFMLGFQWEKRQGRILSHIWWPTRGDHLFTLAIDPDTGTVPVTTFAAGAGPEALRLHGEVLYALRHLNGPLMFDDHLTLTEDTDRLEAPLRRIAGLFLLSDAEAETVLGRLATKGLIRRREY